MLSTIYSIALIVVLSNHHCLAFQSSHCNSIIPTISTHLSSLHYDDLSDLIHNNDDDSNGKVLINGYHLSSISSNGIQTVSNFPRLHTILSTTYNNQNSTSITNELTSSGFINDHDIIQFAKGFINREEVISNVLVNDFQWNVIDAHRCRVGLVELVRDEYGLKSNIDLLLEDGKKSKDKGVNVSSTQTSSRSITPLIPTVETTVPDDTKVEIVEAEKDDIETEEAVKIKQPSWKSVLVNDKAKLRRGKDSTILSNDSTTSSSTMKKKDTYNYGLLTATTTPNPDKQTYSNLYLELDSYWKYMTVPQTSSVSDTPIREQTAKVYLTHARLFIGWMLDVRGVLLSEDEEKVLLDELFGSKNGEGVSSADNSDGMTPSLLGTSSTTADDGKSVRIKVWKHALDRTSTSSSTTESPSVVDKSNLKQGMSLYDIFPSSDTESAAPVLQYILWLRSERGISPNYEANVLRGLIKLVKFRFANELSSSAATPMATQVNGGGRGGTLSSSRSTALDDLPIVIELRKLHREAGNKGKKAPRSSDEGKKWLDWDEYLEVIQLLKYDLSSLIDNYDKKMSEQGVEDDNDQDSIAEKKKQKKQTQAKARSLQVQRKEIATLFQQYLILSFFACVPDRQRTFRELELGRNFIRVDEDDLPLWIIKHTADDYKTGSTYGERPPLPLTASLTAEIDDFLDRWRPSLIKQAKDTGTDNNLATNLFLQPRTGNPLTANSVYQIVSRCCYKYKQKKTNPHLLRDMIVTHVRKNGDASEKELEALALFMGHSISMQRDSYDRRTLEQKVSPAVKLMQDMNALNNGGGSE